MSENSGAMNVDQGTRPRRRDCWWAFILIGCGLPGAIWLCSRLINMLFPVAAHGSPEQRFLLWIVGGAIPEWLFVGIVWYVVRARGSSFSQLGVGNRGTLAAWIIAISAAALSIASNLRFFPAAHIPILYAFMPHGWHLPAALMMGLTAGICEEVLFRGFLMTEFAAAGYGRVMQICLPAIAFGLSHAGLMSRGWLAWIGIVAPTTLLGMVWGLSYLMGKRSLLPPMFAHFLNDATALPWIMFLMFTGR
jgi:membrane protease YdiL (CAAX protease family)